MAAGKVVYDNRKEIGQVAAKTAKAAGTVVGLAGYGVYKAGEWGVKKVVEHRQAIGGAAVGTATGVGQAVADTSGHFTARNKKLKPLIERLNAQSAEYRDRVNVLYRRLETIPSGVSRRAVLIDSIAVGGATLADYASFAVDVPENVERAYQIAYPGLAAKGNFADAVRRMQDSTELQGLASGVKGKLFEIEYVDYLNDNNLPDGYTASLVGSATQPGWDIQVLGPSGHLKDVIQAKATDSANYVHEALQRYPHIDVVTTSEVHGQLLMQGLSDHVTDSGISDVGLEHIVNGASDSATLAMDWMPSSLSLALIAFSAYSQKGLDEYEKSRNFGERASKSYLSYLAGGALAVATHAWWLGVIGGMGSRFLVGAGREKRKQLASLNQLIRANDQVLARLRNM